MRFSIEFQRNTPVWDTPTVRNINLKDRFFLLNTLLYFSNIFYLANNTKLSKTDARGNSSVSTLCIVVVPVHLVMIKNDPRLQMRAHHLSDWKLHSLKYDSEFRLFLAISILLFWTYNCQHILIYTHYINLHVY